MVLKLLSNNGISQQAPLSWFTFSSPLLNQRENGLRQELLMQSQPLSPRNDSVTKTCTMALCWWHPWAWSLGEGCGDLPWNSWSFLEFRHQRLLSAQDLSKGVGDFAAALQWVGWVKFGERLMQMWNLEVSQKPVPEMLKALLGPKCCLCWI